MGEDTLALCQQCGCAANPERASLRRPAVGADPPTVMEEIPTPDCKTIAELAPLPGISASQTLKALFYTTRKVDICTKWATMI
jgi:prolyl-tRNA synthetase